MFYSFVKKGWILLLLSKGSLNLSPKFFQPLALKFGATCSNPLLHKKYQTRKIVFGIFGGRDGIRSLVVPPKFEATSHFSAYLKSHFIKSSPKSSPICQFYAHFSHFLLYIPAIYTLYFSDWVLLKSVKTAA